MSGRPPHYAAGTAHLGAVLLIALLLIVLGCVAVAAWLVGVG